MTFTLNQLNKFKASPLLSGYPTNIRTFYAPEDNVHGALLALINSAKVSLHISMFTYTDVELAAAIQAKMADPSVAVQLTLDLTESILPSEAPILAQYGLAASNDVAIGNSEHGAYMHRKLAVVDSLYRISGSTNWTTSAEKWQDNELTVIKSAAVAAEAEAVMLAEFTHVKALPQKMNYGLTL